MRPPQRALRSRVEYAAVLAGTAARAVLPAKLVIAGMKGIAGSTCRLAAGRRNEALALVSQTLGVPADGPEARAIVRGAFQTLALNTVEPELIEARILRGEPLARYFVVEGEQHLRAALASGRGIQWCSGHLGAWELFPLVMKELAAPIWVVARSLRNPLLERRLLARRQRQVRGTLPMDGGGLRLARILRAGESVGLLLDQNAGRDGVILDFLGLPSSHHNVAGIMARRFGALAVPFYVLREREPLRFRVIVEAPIEADRSLPDDEAALDVTRRLSHSLEARVRAHPEQWFWLHDRWGHVQRRLGRASLAAARKSTQASPPPDDSPRTAAQGADGG